MPNYSDLEEMRLTTKDLSAAQLIDALYSRTESPNAFGDQFARDEVNAIVYSRLRQSFAQEIVRLLMSCVRADAQERGEDVDEAIQIASQAVSHAVEEAKNNKGVYW